MDQLAETILERFDEAVVDRVANQKHVFAFLSGGMDSRLVCSRLRAQGIHVSSLNFAPAGTEDRTFGNEIGRVLGTEHFEFGDETSGSFFARRSAAIEAWCERHVDGSLWPQQPGLVWSGDGGSVGLGHVYLDEAIINAARRLPVGDTAAIILQRGRTHVSPRVFRANARNMADWPLRGVTEDLESRPKVEGGRNAHLFFMLNDQRRHLVHHYETVHETRIDLVLPFFDGRFLEAVRAAPVDPFLQHRLYNHLFARLADGSGAVPWQAYPQHEPCPVVVPEGLRNQWKDGWLDDTAARTAHRRKYVEHLRICATNDFPSEVLSRSNSILSALASLAGIRRVEHIANAAAPFIQAKRQSLRATVAS